MTKKAILIIVLGFFMVSLGWSQQDYRLKIEGAGFVPTQNAGEMAAWTARPNEVIGGKVYRVWQFNEVPGTATWNRLENLGVTQLFYLPEKSFLVSVPAGLSSAEAQLPDLRAVLPWAAAYKAHPEVSSGKMPVWSLKGSRYLLNLSWHADISLETVVSDLASRGFSPHDFHPEAHNLKIEIAPFQLNELLDQPYVSWVSPLDKPGQPEDIIGKSLHRSNAVVNRTTGVPYDGTGVKVMVRDDGVVGPHIDFQGRVINFTNQTGGSHGDLVGGAMAGAGNFDPTIVGSAPRADIYGQRYRASFNDNTLQLHLDSNLVITNSSYSNGCNAGYTNTTQFLDRMLYDYPSFMHVFSAGNSGTSNCNYGAGSGWGNITGGHKIGKNVIAVGNVNDNGFIIPSSSRGPVADGRIKPDVTANGVGFRGPDENNTFQQATGTSFSAPAFAGVMAQMYHAYRDLYQAEPPAALIKAILMNTADDKGNPGPDFEYGYGIVNGFKGYKVLEEGRFIMDSIARLGLNSHLIQVPVGVKQLKVMVYWPDRESFQGSAKNLVEDLDCALIEPTGAAHTPLVLDPTPNAVSLNAPAVEGFDQLNNAEQMVVDQPLAGTYNLDVIGSNVTVGQAPYYVVIEFIKEEIDVTYPRGGEHFVPGETETIRWDAPEVFAPFNIFYNSGLDSVWRIVATGISPAQRHYDWSVPTNVQTAKAKIRVVAGGLTGESPEGFNIMDQPGNVWLSTVCQDEVEINWLPVGDAQAYEVYMLGDRFMEVIGQTSDTFFVVKGIRYQEENWFAVSAIGNGGAKARRTIAISQGSRFLRNCTPQAPVAGFSVQERVCASLPVTLLDTSRFAPESFAWSISPGSFQYLQGSSNTSRFPTVAFTFPGVYEVRLIAVSPYGRDTTFRTVTVGNTPAIAFSTTSNGLDVTFTPAGEPGSRYFWDFGDGNTSTDPNPTHTYAQSGQYQVELTVTTECGEVITRQTVGSYAVSNEPLLGRLDMQVFPNPTAGRFTVQVDLEQSETVEVLLRDMVGRTLHRFSEPVRQGSFSRNFDYGNLIPGVYLVQVNAGKRSRTVKLQVQ